MTLQNPITIPSPIFKPENKNLKIQNPFETIQNVKLKLNTSE